MAVGHVSCSLRLVVVRETATGSLEALVGGVGGGASLPVRLFSHEKGHGVVQTAVDNTLKVSLLKNYFLRFDSICPGVWV